MGKIAGIVTFDIARAEERLRHMLSISSSNFSEPKDEIVSHHYQNCDFGVTGGTSASNETKTIAAVFVGQLFRKEKLIDALKYDKNRYFDSPAELIIAGFETLGTDLFAHLDGDFVFTLFDHKHKALYIVRDKMGTHDLFWSSNRHALLFGSSLKALLSTGLISPSVNHEQLACYLALGYISQDKTPIQGINRLLPGYYIKASLDQKLSIHSFWSFSAGFSKSKKRSFATSQELFEEIQKYISRAVACRVQQNLPYGAVGGQSIGANLIHEVLSENQHLPVPSLSTQFSGTSDPSDSVITPAYFLKNLASMIWSMEIPSSDFSHFSNYHFASKCHKLNLSPFFDTGFDQEFYDYSSPAVKHTMEQGRKPSNITEIFQYVGQKFYRLYALMAPQLALKSLRKMQTKDPRIHFLERESLFPGKKLIQAAPTIGKLFQGDLFLHQFYHLPKVSSEPASLFYLMMKTEVVDKIHTIRSKFALDFATVPQSPFLDLEFIEFLASLEESVWASPDMLASFPTTFLMNQEYSISKEKKSFSAFLRDPQIMAVFQTLRTGFLVETGFIAAQFVEETLRDTSDNSPRILYQLLVLELWMRLFVDLPLSQSNTNLSLNELLR